MTSSTEQNPPLVDVQQLSVGYTAGKPLLEDISFSIFPREIFAIMGPSGCGKTTLFKHLIGLKRPQSGDLRVLDHSLAASSKEKLFDVRKKIGVAFQHGALINSMNLIENVELPLVEHTRLDKMTIRIMSRMKLEMMGLLDAENLMPAQLSGGMLKRAGLARAVVMDPQILFFDEPSAGLDPGASAELDDLLLQLRELLNITIIIVTHDLDSAFKVADRVLMLAEGKIAALGSVEQLKQSESAVVQSLLQRRSSRERLSGDAYIEQLTHD
ncbi:MAG: ATP-binding cassette domain-containing protein [Pseudomonadota bacterium]